MFLTGLIAQTKPLSVESSACVRAGMQGIDLRSVMMAGPGRDEQTAMAGSMPAMILALSCLNDDEFSDAAPALGMTAEDRETAECMLGQLGGPEVMAAVLGSDDETALMELFTIAMDCGLQMEGAPTP